MRKRHAALVLGISASLLVLAITSRAAAQTTRSEYPAGPIIMIVPFPPAGPTDAVARIIAQKLSEQWSRPVVVDNRPGAGGTIGVAAASKAPADGYTIVMGGSSNLAVAPSLYAKLPYDPLRDLTPVANVASGPYVLAVHATVPATSVQELIKLAKSRKGLLTYGSAGRGSSSNLAGELLRSTAGIDILQVPYKGAAPLVTAVLAGEIDIIFADFSALAPSAKAGKIRMLAAIGSSRIAAAPDLPTVAEAGVRGYAVDVWFGIMAPAGTPRSIVATLNSAILNGLNAREVRERLQRLGYEPIGGTPEQFGATLRADIEKFRRIVRSANIAVE